MIRTEFRTALLRVTAGERPTREQLVALLQSDDEEFSLLAAAADRVRRTQVGDAIWLRGLIEFSNICRRRCLYCGLRAENQTAERFRMSEEEILHAVRQVAARGLGTVVLQSGEDAWWNCERLTALVESIKREHRELAVTLSIGERSRAEYARLRTAGADRFLMRFETSNPQLYARMHPDSSLDERLQCLSWLTELGYEVGSGSLVGLPGQTLLDLASDLLLMQQLQLDMIGIGPFIPHPCTPLADAAGGTAGMTLRMMAITRLLCPKVNMPVTTALAALDPRGRERGWQAGANVVMPSATPVPYKQQYELYPDKPCLDDQLTQCLTCLQGRIESIDRHLGSGRGNSPAWEAKQHAEDTAQ